MKKLLVKFARYIIKKYDKDNYKKISNVHVRQCDYYSGAKAFARWLLSNYKYSGYKIDTNGVCIHSDDSLIISKNTLVNEFEKEILPVIDSLDF